MFPLTYSAFLGILRFMNTDQLLNLVFWNNSIAEYLASGIWFVGWITVLLLFQWVLKSRVKNSNEVTHIQGVILQLLAAASTPFLIILSLYLAVQSLVLPELAQKIFFISLVIMAIQQVMVAAQIIANYITRTQLQDEPSSKNAFQTITTVAKFFIAILGFLFILQNVGINVTSLIAGLGIGGIAIALAAQNILGDLFSSFAILFDKPFVPGDFIVVGKNSGVVQKVGIKTTRIRALQGEEIVIPNKELTSARIQNFKKLQERRVAFNVGVTYDTPTAKLKKIPGIVQKIVEDVKTARYDRTHLCEFGDSALIFEIVYYITESDYVVYMDAQQEIDLGIIEAFAKNKIQFAFPTQTVHVLKS